MGVSDKLYESLTQGGNPWNAQPDGPATSSTQPTDAPPKTPFQSTGKYLADSFKEGIEQSAEISNQGARMFYRNIMGLPPDDFEHIPAYLQRGTPGKALGIDHEGLKRGTGNALIDAVRPALRGTGQIVSLPAPGVAQETAVATAVKQIMLGAGAGEGGELGKWVFGGLASMMFDDPAIKQGAEAVGEVAGGAGAGWANNVRGNAMVSAAKTPVNAVKNVSSAMKATAAAKRAGDERTAWSIFTDQYATLKKAGLGMLQQQTNEKIAAIIARDPQHQQELQTFDDATRRVDVDAGLFTLPQRTGNRTLSVLEANRSFKTPEEAAAALQRKDAQKASISNAYKSVAGKAALPTDPLSFMKAVELERTSTLAKVDQLEQGAAKVRKGVTNWDANAESAAGNEARNLYDAEKGKAQAEFNKRYQDIYAQAEADGVRINLQPVLKDTGDVLKPLLAKVDTGSAPQSIRNLNNLLKKQQRQTTADADTAGNIPFYMKRDAVPGQPKGYSFREVDDVVKELGNDAHDAFRRGDTVEGTNLNKIGEALLGQLDKQATDGVRTNYAKVRADYRDKYAPRFKEGANFNMDREATATNRGRERVTDQKVWDQYLSKNDISDRMEQFDNLYGGRLAEPNPAAYKQLGVAVEDRYSKEVLRGGFSPEKHQKFMDEYAPALDRSPAVRRKLNDSASNLDAINTRKTQLLDKYKETVGSPVTSAVGPVQARQMFTQALADPLKMERLLASPIANTTDKAKSVLKEAMVLADPQHGAMYDPGKLDALLTMGAKVPGGPSTLDMLFDKALGPMAGRAHKYRLQALNEIMKREQLTDPKNLRFDTMDNAPVKGATGNTMASILSGARSMDAGFGAHYYPLVFAGRFLNNATQKAVEDAMGKALYDPQMSQAVLELARQPANGSISKGTFSMIFGSGKAARELLRKMTDHGMIRAQMARGALVGGTDVVEPPADEDAGKPARRRTLQ